MKSRSKAKGTSYLLCAVVAMSLAVVAPIGVYEKTAAEDIRELKETIASNRVNRLASNDCRYYTAWFVDLCTREELAAILERNIAAHRRWMELEPGNPVPHAGLADVFATVGRWKEAKPELEAALAARDKLDAKGLALALWEMANCLWVEGDKNGAKKLVDEVAAMYGTGKVSDFLFVTGQAKFLSAEFAGKGDDLDMLKLPHSVDGKPFPNSQEAEYGDERVSLAKVEVVFGTNGTSGADKTSPASRISPASPEDPIIRLLKRKLSRFGSTFASDGTKVFIEISPDAPVDKPQGYELKVQSLGGLDGLGGLVSIKARDRLGATWGVVSFLQCVDRGENRSRAA